MTTQNSIIKYANNTFTFGLTDEDLETYYMAITSCQGAGYDPREKVIMVMAAGKPIRYISELIEDTDQGFCKSDTWVEVPGFEKGREFPEDPQEGQAESTWHEMREAEMGEVKMFGCTIAEMTDFSHMAIPVDMTNPKEVKFHATCILSDAQEELAMGNTEDVRQYINRAKYFLSKC